MKKLVLLLALLAAPAWAQFDPAKPATGTPPVSADMRNNFTALQKTLSGAFAIVDPLFKSWPAGNSAVPQGAALSGAGAAIARAGIGMGDTSRKFGKWTAKVTAGGGATAILSKDLITSSDYDDGHDLLMWSFGAWVRCSSASSARLGIHDGAGTTYSSYHTGSGNYEWLTVSRQIDAAATLVQVRMEVAASIVAYTAAWSPLFGETPPSYPYPDLQALVDRWADQSIYGTKTFQVQPLAIIGTSTISGRVGGVFASDVAPHAVAAASTDSVMTDSEISANMLSADGKAVRVYFGSSTADTGANTKTIELDVGGTQITFRSGTANGTFWYMQALIIRIDSDSVDVVQESQGATTLTQAVTRINGLSFTAAIDLRTLGTTGAGSTLTQTYFLAEAVN